jgi:hypothetical protein
MRQWSRGKALSGLGYRGCLQAGVLGRSDSRSLAARRIVAAVRSTEQTVRRARRGSLAALALGSGLWLVALFAPTSAFATIQCAYDGNAKTLTIQWSNTGPTIERDSPAAGSAIRPCASSGATVDNTDTIVVTRTADMDEVSISHANGPVGPGADPEFEPCPPPPNRPPGCLFLPGTPEIEIQINGGVGSDRVILRGGPGVDHFRFGDGGVNLNADEAVGQDVDLTTSSVEFYSAFGEGGNDVASGEGGLGTGAAYAAPLLFRGGDDNDQLTGGEVVDFLAGDSGNDMLRGGDGDDRGLDGGPGDDTVDGQGGTGDVGRYFGAPAGVTVDLGQTGPQNTGGDGTDTLSNLEHLEGSFYDDVLTGDDGPNQIRASLGADTLDGRGGNDYLDGGELIAPSDPDTATYASAASGVTADLAAGQAEGGGGTDTLVDVQNLIGSDFADALTGNAEENVLTGGEGPDILTGGAGGDDVRGEGGFDGLRLRDGTRDTGDCGPEADSVTADAFGVDAIAPNCETIDYLGGLPPASPESGSDTPGNGGSPAESAPSGTDIPSNVFRIARIRPSRRTGGATIVMNLPGPGVVKAVATASVPARLLRTRAAIRITAARKKLTVAQGGKTRLSLRPTRAARRALARKRKLRVRLVLTYTPTGGTPSTQRRAVTLKLRRRR